MAFIKEIPFKYLCVNANTLKIKLMKLRTIDKNTIIVPFCKGSSLANTKKKAKIVLIAKECVFNSGKQNLQEKSNEAEVFIKENNNL